MMPIREFLEKFDPTAFDPATFDADQFKKDALAEFEHDETAWRAAVTQKDATIAETSGKLTAAQAKAWELLQQVPGTKTPELEGQKDAEDSTDVGFDDIFTKQERA